MQMQPPALPRGTITGVFLRPPGAAGSEIFERCAQADGVEVGLGLLGLQGSQEWHRLEKSAGKLSSADAADRAVLMQVHAAIARVMREHPITPPPPPPPVRSARAAAAAGPAPAIRSCNQQRGRFARGLRRERQGAALRGKQMGFGFAVYRCARDA